MAWSGIYLHGLSTSVPIGNQARLVMGDITKSKIEWRLDRGVPLTPSPLLVGNELYMVADNGIATCVDAKTGQELWRARLGGNHSASPIYADGKIYFLSEEGESVVIAPGRELKHLATNQLDGPTLASMAVSSVSLFHPARATHLTASVKLGLQPTVRNVAPTPARRALSRCPECEITRRAIGPWPEIAAAFRRLM
jgi:hypothetical protein